MLSSPAGVLLQLTAQTGYSWAATCIKLERYSKITKLCVDIHNIPENSFLCRVPTDTWLKI